MGYKTFEDMKSNIPEGATHYFEETDMDYFAWVKYMEGYKFCIMPDSIHFNKWHRRNLKGVKPIPQIETPEEKEALDMIDTTSKQVESLASKPDLHDDSAYSSEWSVGDKCRYGDINWVFCGFHPVNGLAIVSDSDEPSSHRIITVAVSLLSKPEPPQQREDRERL